MQAYINEKVAPEILQYEEDLVSRMQHEIKHQVRHAVSHVQESTPFLSPVSCTADYPSARSSVRQPLSASRQSKAGTQESSAPGAASGKTHCPVRGPCT